MAKKKQGDSFTNDLIASLNKEQGSKVAYNLSCDTSPTHVKRWISTGSKYMDFIISNRRNGGLPEGRIVEIFGPPSIGKSHIATQIAKSTQDMGGIVVYIDTENATSIENLEQLGIDIKKRFIYVGTHCTEDVLKIAESTILKAKALEKDVPVTIVWDSVAASSPRAELDGEYEKNSIGLQARAISKGMRKITGVIGDQNVLFVCLNQIRVKIGVMFGDPTTTPGGKAIPFHSSVRLKLGAGSQIKNKDKEIIGINVWAKTIKNKVAFPFRKAEFQIHFGKGIREHEELFDLMRANSPVKLKNGNIAKIEGTGAWKTFSVEDKDGKEVLAPIKFYKPGFEQVIKDHDQLIDDILDVVLVKTFGDDLEQDIDTESLEEIKEVGRLMGIDTE